MKISKKTRKQLLRELVPLRAYIVSFGGYLADDLVEYVDIAIDLLKDNESDLESYALELVDIISDLKNLIDRIKRDVNNKRIKRRESPR